jgi:hypothetical protein
MKWFALILYKWSTQAASHQSPITRTACKQGVKVIKGAKENLIVRRNEVVGAQFV